MAASAPSKGESLGFAAFPEAGCSPGTSFFTPTQLLGALGEPGHLQRSFPKLTVVGLAGPGLGSTGDNSSRRFWATGWVSMLLHGEGRNLFPPWELYVNKPPAVGFPPGCARVSATDAWSPRSWRKKSRMSTRPPISRACSTSSSSVRTAACCKLVGLCSVRASPRYLHVSPPGDRAPRRGSGMGRREGANASVGALKGQSKTADGRGHLSGGDRSGRAGGVAALRTSRKMRDAHAESSPELAGPCRLPGKKRDAFGSAEATLWQRQGSHSSSSARVNGNQATRVMDLLPSLWQSSQHRSGSGCFSLWIWLARGGSWG